jgi:hypothetical protein
MKAELRSPVAHLRGTALGAIEVRASEEVALSIVAKDRLKVTTQGDRLFEAIAALSARTAEIRRKLIVREINLLSHRAVRRSRDGGTGAGKSLPALSLQWIINSGQINSRILSDEWESDKFLHFFYNFQGIFIMTRAFS